MNRHVEMMHGADRELKLTLTPHCDSVMNSRDKNDADAERRAVPRTLINTRFHYFIGIIHRMSKLVCSACTHKKLQSSLLASYFT
jgi:hypothetical protein